MLKLIAATTVALAGLSATLGGLGIGLVLLGAMAWMLLVFRPMEAGPIVASWSRRRFE
jgi:hypothetical protein